MKTIPHQNFINVRNNSKKKKKKQIYDPKGTPFHTDLSQKSKRNNTHQVLGIINGRRVKWMIKDPLPLHSKK